MQVLLILNDPPYGTERCYNGLRLALALGKSNPPVSVTVFLMADAVTAAKSGQKTPDGYYNVERMLKGILAGKGQILLCGTCMDARGLADAEILNGVRRETQHHGRTRDDHHFRREGVGVLNCPRGAGMPPIYLDYNASTPIDPAVAAAMRPFLDEAFGNPSSGHWASAPAKEALEQARSQVAALIGAAPDEIVFTSGGSEANNLAIKGTYFALNRKGAHIITTAVEHPAVLTPCRFLERLGASVSYIPVDRTGRVDPDDVRRAITPQSVLISIMHANNEVGTIQPIEEIGSLARERGIRFHTDAAQSVGKVLTKVDKLGVDLLSIAGHKLYAPKGVGALYVRRGLELEPLIHGAGHELGRRAGTESALLAVGLGTACEMAADLEPMQRVQTLRDRFWRLLQDRFGDRVVLNGHVMHRLPNTLNVSFVGKVGADVLLQLNGVAASTGSACHSGRIELSPVLAAMSVPERIGMGAIRFSLGRDTTAEEIDDVVTRLAGIASA